MPPPLPRSPLPSCSCPCTPLFVALDEQLAVDPPSPPELVVVVLLPSRRECYGDAMKDYRVKEFRTTLDALRESLDALVRVTRWSGNDDAPEPLRVAVSRLESRLAAANRLVGGAFAGSPADTAKVSALCAAMRRLDAAYVAFRERVDADAGDAASTLENEVFEATNALSS